MTQYLTNKGGIRVQIQSLESGEIVDISSFVARLFYYENIYTNSISLNMIISDGSQIMSRLPIVGGEKVFVSIQSPGDEIPEALQTTFRLYAISNRQKVNINLETYTLNCTTEELLRNSTMVVDTSFDNNVISEYVKSIFNQNIQGISQKKLISLEPTTGIRLFYPTRKDPFSYINFLSSEAQSDSTISSSYVFFENKEGYHFTTIERLLQKNPIQALEYNVYNSPIEGAQGNRNIIKLENDQTFDLLKNQMKGQFAVRTNSIDPVRKTFFSSEYDYISEFDNTKHCSDTPNRTLHPSARDVVASKPTLEMYFVTDYGLTNSEYVKTNSPREAQRVRQKQNFSSVERSTFMQLQSVTSKIRIPGNPYIKAGDVVYINIPKPDHFTGSGDFPFLTSGKYLVTALSHSFFSSNFDFYTSLEIMKDSYETKVTEIAPEILPTRLVPISVVAGPTLKQINDLANATIKQIDALIS